MMPITQTPMLAIWLNGLQKFSHNHRNTQLGTRTTSLYRLLITVLFVGALNGRIVFLLVRETKHYARIKIIKLCFCERVSENEQTNVISSTLLRSIPHNRKLTVCSRPISFCLAIPFLYLALLCLPPFHYFFQLQCIFFRS